MSTILSSQNLKESHLGTRTKDPTGEGSLAKGIFMKIIGASLRGKQPLVTSHKFKMKFARMDRKFTLFTIIFLAPLFLRVELHCKATSINYGISQRPITDISQLMPTLCQNQSVICEGSFCIPGLRRCVCDLRQPVQFGRFCLRQVDIETKCFVSNQCNHTTKDAVCMDVSSNSVLDVESSRFKLEQWQQLSELRQASKSAVSNQESMKQRVASATNLLLKPMFLTENRQNELTFEARDHVIMSSYRNSPYEINYYTPELLHQNHTRRKTNSSADRTNLGAMFGNSLDPASDENQNEGSRATTTMTTTIMTTGDVAATSSSNHLIHSIIAAETTAPPTTLSTQSEETQTTTTPDSATSPVAFRIDLNEAANKVVPAAAETSPATTSTTPPATTTTTTTITVATLTTTTTQISELSKKKMIVKTSSWPPGVCSCPKGYMFDSMLRKCLALSLADSHCQSDNDCKQIRLTHCFSETRKCECDEPLTWNQTELACQRPRTVTKSDIQATNQPREGFLENLFPPLLIAKILPDQTVLLLIFVIILMICTLVLLRLIMKCFSSSNSALISPKNSKKRKADSGGNLLAPKSPYATLRKPEHKPNMPLANFTQTTRGRILNYDFEQENPLPDARSRQSPQQAQTATYVAQKHDQRQHHHYGTLERTSALVATAGATMSRQKHPHKHKSSTHETDPEGKPTNISARGTPDGKLVDECLELNDNVSLGGQLDSESKSESISVMAIPGPPPTLAPPYMLASAMKGQGSAIAAAAAAVANRRMQMAHQKADTTNSSKIANGTPVFL